MVEKDFFWCLEVSIVNAYILYSCHTSDNGMQPMSHVKFRRSLVESLVAGVRNPRNRSRPGSADREERLNKLPHFVYHYEQKKHKDCVVCSNRKVKGGRKEIYYYCKTCSNHPAMCPGECFRKIPFPGMLQIILACFSAIVFYTVFKTYSKTVQTTVHDF